MGREGVVYSKGGGRAYVKFWPIGGALFSQRGHFPRGGGGAGALIQGFTVRFERVEISIEAS